MNKYFPFNEDLIIIGDGSGSTKDRCSGWSAIAYLKEKDEIKHFYGCANCGTNNYAELQPFLQSLWYYWQLQFAEKILVEKIRLISDSEWVCKTGRRLYSRTDINGSLWAALDFFEQHGWHFEWNWIARCSNGLAVSVDKTAQSLRKMMEGLDTEDWFVYNK